jgi:peptidoglycan/LPS O-acetylase OafA/YrhL
MFFLLHQYAIPIFGTSQEDILQYGDRVHATTMCRSAGIACGLFASWARVLRPRSMEKRFPPSLLMGAVLLLSGIVLSVPEFMGYPTSVAYLGMSHVGTSACAAIIVFRLLRGDVPSLGRVLGARALVPVARLSYSLYLLHPIVYWLLSEAFAKRRIAPSDRNVALLMVASVLGSFCCAMLMYLLVEKPIMDRRQPAIAPSVAAQG